MRILILIDGDTIAQLKSGSPPTAPYSHDKNLFQFGHESLRYGYEVFVSDVQASAQSRLYYRVHQIYPLWTWDGMGIGFQQIRPDIVVSVFPEALNVRQVFPDAKIVAIHAATQWIEVPERFPAQYTYDLITAIRYNIDFMITQNERMKEILETMYMFLAKWPYKDRILVAPLGIVQEERKSLPDRASVRKTMGLSDRDIGIINSGGIWRWTDFNNFFEAFCSVARKRNTRLKLFIMGVKQSSNLDHEDYIDEFEEKVYRNRDLIGDRIVLFRDWNEASKIVKEYTFGADVGLNVNKSTLENWQSYRLRFLDYLYFGMPAINTYGDVVSERYPDAVYLNKPGDVEGYKNILKHINGHPSSVRLKGRRMEEIARDYDSKNTYGLAVKHIIKTPRRNIDDSAGWGDTVLDYASIQISKAIRDKFKNSVIDLIY
jgi:hypothetical protein